METVHIVPLAGERPAQFAERLGREYANASIQKEKKHKGQFFTPLAISAFMGGLATPSKKKEVSILDPGCGLAILSCALIEHLIESGALSKITLTLYETDKKVIPLTEAVMNHLKDWCGAHKVVLEYQLNETDFVLDKCECLDGADTIFGEMSGAEKYDYIISNPPYFKLAKDDVHTRSCASTITEEALAVVKSYGKRSWKKKVEKFVQDTVLLREKYAAERDMHRIPLIIESNEYYLSPGTHNEVQAAVVEEFAPRFAPGGKLLYIGDTEDKDLYVNVAGLEALNLPITEHSKLPDIVISDDKHGWLFMIEVVTSHGPVSAKRVVELEDFAKDCPYGIVYVTAFPNAKEFKKHIDNIAWETEVWLSDTPDHMIHFNGDRFIGPRK